MQGERRPFSLLSFGREKFIHFYSNSSRRADQSRFDTCPYEYTSQTTGAPGRIDEIQRVFHYFAPDVWTISPTVVIMPKHADMDYVTRLGTRFVWWVHLVLSQTGPCFLTQLLP
jgi:hypothetical protein